MLNWFANMKNSIGLLKKICKFEDVIIILAVMLPYQLWWGKSILFDVIKSKLFALDDLFNQYHADLKNMISKYEYIVSIININLMYIFFPYLILSLMLCLGYCFHESKARRNQSIAKALLMQR